VKASQQNWGVFFFMCVQTKVFNEHAFQFFFMLILPVFLGSNVNIRCSHTEMLNQNLVPVHCIPEKKVSMFCMNWAAHKLKPYFANLLQPPAVDLTKFIHPAKLT